MALAKRFMVDAPRAVVVGRPSQALGAAMAKAEAERLAAQKAALGPARLAELAAALEEATKANDAPFPEEILRQFAVPPVANISTHRVATLRSHCVPPAPGEPSLPAPPAGARLRSHPCIIPTAAPLRLSSRSHRHHLPSFAQSSRGTRRWWPRSAAPRSLTTSRPASSR